MKQFRRIVGQRNLFSITRMQLDNIFIFLIALFILITNGTWLQHDYNVVVKFILLLILILFFLYYGIEKKLSKPNYLILFFVFFPLFSTYVVNFSLNVNVVNIINTSLLLILFSFLPFDILFKLFEKYCRMVFSLICIAVPLGILFLIAPQLLEKAPIVYSPFFDVAGGYWYNLIVYTERSINDFRVQSVFWEPGAWAYNQMIAFYFLIYVRKEYKKIPIFLLSILLTLSTSGLLACFICLIPLVKKLNKKSLVIVLTLLLFFTSIIIYLLLSNEILSEIIYQNTIGKFSSDHVSFEERTTTAATAFRIANEHWFFGIGRLDNESFMYVTSCISEISYQLGYLYLVIYFISFLQIFKKLGIFLGLLFSLVLLNSEAYSFFTLNIFIITLGSKLLFRHMQAYNMMEFSNTVPQ